MPIFSVGVNYRPASSATAMWDAFDAGEIRDDFAHIAALGLDTVRFALRWDRFQPEPATIDAIMVGRLETLVSLAHDAGLQTIPVLLGAHVAGVNYLPAWALDSRTPAKRFRTLTAENVSPFGAADLYAEPLREPQTFFARTVGERLRGHPGIRAWDLANAIANVREPVHRKLSTGDHSSEPAGEREMAAWSSALATTLREASALPTTVGIALDDLTRDRDVRLGSLCARLGFASILGLGVENPFARNRLDPEGLPFLAMLAATFSFKPVLVAGFGNPTCPPGKYSAFERFAQPGEPPNVTISALDTTFASYPCASEDENAAYCSAVLERLHADGRLGALWWNWTDHPRAIAERPPFDLAPWEAACGVVRADGSEKPVAAALSAFARQKRAVVEPDELPAIAAAYYYRTLPKSAATLFDAYLRFVDERRS